MGKHAQTFRPEKNRADEALPQVKYVHEFNSIANAVAVAVRSLIFDEYYQFLFMTADSCDSCYVCLHLRGFRLLAIAFNDAYNALHTIINNCSWNSVSNAQCGMNFLRTSCVSW